MKWFFLLCLVGLAACQPCSAQTLVVAAASNLAPLEAPLSDAFAQKNPGLRLQFIWGSSGGLVTQMLAGAPYQAFLSADREFAQKLVDAGLAAAPVKTYAVGRLIFVALQPVDLSKGLAVVLDPAVGQFAIANPETAPYGRAAVEAMTKTGVFAAAKLKLVTGQNITQALQFLLTVTNFGVVNKSALFSTQLLPYNQQGKFWFEVDPSLYSPIEQGFVILKTAQNTPEGRAFAEFLLSPSARQVFAAYGYGAE